VKVSINFWKDKDRRIVEPDLFYHTAKQQASSLIKDGNGKMNKRTQIRRFYDEVINLKQQLKQNPEEFEIRLPYIRMLIAKAHYANGRDHVTESFVDFIKDSISQVEDVESFEVFATFFEAVMGFHKFEEEQQKKNNKLVIKGKVKGGINYETYRNN